MSLSINAGLHHVFDGIYYCSSQAYNQIDQLCSSVANVTFSLYDIIYRKNPLTQTREIQTFPLMCLSDLLPCECTNTSGISNSYLDRLVQKIGCDIEKISQRKNLKFSISSDRSTTWTCHNGDVNISRKTLLHLEKIWLNRESKYRDIRYEDLVANHIAHEISHFNGLHTQKKVEKRIFFHLTVIKVFQVVVKILNVSIIPSLLLLNMFFIVIMEGIFKHKISYYSIGLLLAGIEMNLLLLGTLNAGIALLLCFGLSLASGLVSDALDQSCELEADQYSMHYLSQAGYNPRALLCLASSEKDLTITRWQMIKNIFFHTFGVMDNHPSSAKRLENGKKTLIELSINNSPRYLGLAHRIKSISYIERHFYSPIAYRK